MTQNDKRLFILGAGGHGKVVADAAEQCATWSEIAFLDDGHEPGTVCEGWTVVAGFSAIESIVGEHDEIIVALGSNAARQKFGERATQAGLKLATLIHPTASVSPRSTIAPGTVVLAGSTIAISSRIGAGCIVNTRASIDHDCHVGDYCHISPGAHIGGTVSIGDHCWVGIGACVVNNLTLGDQVTVGAGAAVIRDVASTQTVVGVPARAR